MYRKTIISALASAALLLSACGGSASSDTSDGIASIESVVEDEGAASTESDAELSEDDINKAYADYEQCLADIGLGDLFGGDEGGVETDIVVESSGDGGVLSGDPAELDEQFARMEDECDPIIAEVNEGFELSPEQEAARADADLEFARCMRDAGFDFPDPSASDSAGQVIEIGGEDLDIDALNEASNECNSAFDSLNELLDGEEG